VNVKICDVDLYTDSAGGENDPMEFSMVLALDSSLQLRQSEFYVDYPSDFMEFAGVDDTGAISGPNWTAKIQQPGYIKLTLGSGVGFAEIPARTLFTKSELAQIGNQNLFMYIDSSVTVGYNGQ